MKKFDDDTFITVVIMTCYLQCGINALVCYRASHNKTLINNLMALWQKHCRCKVNSFKKYAKSLRTLVIISIICYVLVVLCLVGFTSYLFFADIDDSLQHTKEVFLTPFKNPHPVLKGFLVVLQAHLAGIWILPVLFFALVCRINKYMLADTSDIVQKDLRLQTHQYLGDLEAVRLHNEAAFDMVECADEIFSLFVALGLATDIPLACLSLYMMISPDTQSDFLMIFNSFLLVLFTVHMMVILWEAAKVNLQVSCFNCYRYYLLYNIHRLFY